MGAGGGMGSRDVLRVLNITGILQNMQICNAFSAVHIMLYVTHSQQFTLYYCLVKKPSSSSSLLTFIYVTSQLRHSLAVHLVLRKILDPPVSLLNKPGIGTTGMGAPRALYLGLSVRIG